MFFWVFIVFLVIIIYYISSNHIHIDWQSLFKKGFAKNDNYFGLYCYTGKQGTRKNI